MVFLKNYRLDVRDVPRVKSSTGASLVIAYSQLLVFLHARHCYANRDID